MRDEFVDVSSILVDLEVPHFLVLDTALGAVLNGGFISNFDDINIGIVDDPGALIMQLLDDLEDDGFVVDTIRAANSSFLIKCVRNTVRVILFFFYQEEGQAWCALETMHRYTYPANLVLPPIEHIFLGIHTHLPAKPSEYLEAHYGPTWRTPNPAWNCLTDPLSVRPL